MGRGFVAVAVLLAPVASLAMDVAPADDALVRVVVEGRAMATTANGYDVREYLLQAVADARNILPDQGSVDAVILLTPLERLRHAAYLQAMSGLAGEPAATAARTLYVPEEVGFRVFAHGIDGGDSGFTERFQIATLRVGEQTFVPVRIERSPASIGRYPLAPRNRERTVGTVTYWFQIDRPSEWAQASANLSFRDAEGKAVDVLADFAVRR